ncbi:hypothetical protein DL95DRAFT_512260 [Leptodontidium sp. 2 PMI_412]|nr:hypothetical protein DL95DRAFT_512260 [Leptodontidium sp. 2 PMI_412]
MEKQYNWPKANGEDSVNAVATINYSPGTIGLPKGVCASHHNLIANIEQTLYMKYLHKPFDKTNHPPERWVGFLPLTLPRIRTALHHRHGCQIPNPSFTS